MVRFLGSTWACLRARQHVRNLMPKTPSNPCIAMTAQVHSVLLFTEYNWVRDVLRSTLLHALKRMKKSSKSYHFGPQLCLQKGFQIMVPLGIAVFLLFNFSNTILGLNLASKKATKSHLANLLDGLQDDDPKMTPKRSPKCPRVTPR